LKQDIIEYIKSLQKERSNLLNRINYIENELQELQTIASFVKPSAIETNSPCYLCNGTGEYFDQWAGNSPCPLCN
jgi:hypothetical protein